MIALDEDKQAIVMGLGRFGGGLGATRYLLSRGMQVIVTDRAQESDLKESINTLKSEDSHGRLKFMLGGHDDVPFETSDPLIVNPAVPEPWNNAYLQRANNAGVVTCTEMELLLDRLHHLGQDHLIAVTGSAGKSTICSMIAHLAKKSGRRCLLGGNIGGSLLNRSDEQLVDAEVIVLEISSFMLHWIKQGLVPFQPEVGVLTSLDENHIDWHGSLEHYITCKSLILDSQQYIAPINDNGVSVSVSEHLSNSKEEQWWRASEDDWTSRLRKTLLNEVRTSLPGAHQRENAATACIALAALASKPQERADFARSLSRLIADFEGLAHRLRPLGTSSGVLVVDDSKSTTPGATQRAVEAFEDLSKVHLIAGGFDKGADLSEIASLSVQLGGLYGVGQTGPVISAGPDAIECKTVSQAVTEASKQLAEGDVLLLSPGCASWDQFSNYEERGRVFKEAVERSLGTLKK